MCGLRTGLDDEPRELLGRVHTILDGALDIVLLLEGWVACDLHNIGMHTLDDRPRRACRREQSEPGYRIILAGCFLEGRHFREQRRTCICAECDPGDVTASDLGKHVAQSEQGDWARAGHDSVDHLVTAAERHTYD